MYSSGEGEIWSQLGSLKYKAIFQLFLNCKKQKCGQRCYMFKLLCPFTRDLIFALELLLPQSLMLLRAPFGHFLLFIGYLFSSILSTLNR